MIKTISAKELGTKLGLAKSTTHLHLASFEKYRQGTYGEFRYTYNADFLKDLKEFYFEKSKCISKRYKMYKPIVKKIEKLQKAYQTYLNNKRTT